MFVVKGKRAERERGILQVKKDGILPGKEVSPVTIPSPSSRVLPRRKRKVKRKRKAAVLLFCVASMTVDSASRKTQTNPVHTCRHDTC